MSVSRTELTKHLESKKIQTRNLFAGNLVKHPCFDEMRKTGKGYRLISNLKVTDHIMNNTFWVGVYPEMNDKMIELNEIKMLLEKTSNPIKDLDEFKFFGDMLQYLKNNKTEIYYKWENNLNQEQKEKIVNLINTKGINIQTNEQGKIQVARRIVTIKRNQS